LINADDTYELLIILSLRYGKAPPTLAGYGDLLKAILRFAFTATIWRVPYIEIFEWYELDKDESA